jgi:tripartite-type tricarboxylate transporter receptor subunit TctC
MKRLIIALLCLAFAPLTARAEYPDKPVALIVPLPAGGPTDAVARSVADSLSRLLGKPIVVENKPGADGVIGAKAAIAAPADGYTLLFGIGSLVALPYVQSPSPYNAERDLAPISTIGRFPFVLSLHPSVPAKTVAELVAHAKANPGRLFYASSTVGEALAATEFMKATGIQMTRVPYKGSAQAVPDLLAGRVHAMFSPIAGVLPAARDGKLRLLAMISPERAPAAPDVPTLAEAGVQAVDVPTWQAIFAPASTPKAIVDRLNATILAALKTEELHQKLAGIMLQVEPSTPEELRARIKRESGMWEQFAREDGLASH